MRAFSFPKRLRLRGERAFGSMFREGVRARGALLLVLARANDLPETRIGISVARKVTRSSPERNRLKRIVREAFRLSRAGFPRGLDLVVCPQVKPAGFPLDRVSAELSRLVEQAAAKVERSRSRTAGAGP